MFHEEYPCAVEDSTIQHLVVGSVGDESTSSLFVGDIIIVEKEDYAMNCGNTYFVSYPKKNLYHI